MQHLINHRCPSNENPNAKFAMNRLEFGLPSEQREPLTSPPYEFNMDEEAYHIYFNMFGISESAVKLGLDVTKNSFTVFAEREKKYYTDQFLWVFSMPANADLNAVESYYNNGVVQFRFPKYRAEFAGAI
jgi:HSP20 family molecular chaperone IbpA